MPHDLRVSYAEWPITPGLQADLDRLEVIWAWARDTAGGDGPWLAGPHSAADAFFAPLASRIATYNLPASEPAQAYVAAHLAHPSFRRWRAISLVDGADQEIYARDQARRPWPGPEPLLARSVEDGTPENEECLYSGKPVTYLMKAGGRVFGFCNALCRDKTVADPLAWPIFATAWDTER